MTVQVRPKVVRHAIATVSAILVDAVDDFKIVFDGTQHLPYRHVIGAVGEFVTAVCTTRGRDDILSLHQRDDLFKVFLRNAGSLRSCATVTQSLS